jgi:hypothetical protein
MKQTRKRHAQSNASEKLSVIRNAFSNKKSRRRIVGGSWSKKDLLLAMIVYGRKQTPPIKVSVDNDSTTSPEKVMEELSKIQNNTTTQTNTMVAAAPAPAAPSTAVAAAPAPAPAIPNKANQQLTVVLPFFLQIYESLYDDKNYSGTTSIKRHTKIPNRAIMEYVVREIQEIEKKHPHPQLFESIFYFWNVFNLSTALEVMMAYLNEIPAGEESASSKPGQIVTIIEKQLGNASSFREWDNSITKPHDYRIYTKTVGQKFNPFQYANGTLLALTEHPFTPYNPFVDRRDMDISVDKETGELANITNTGKHKPPTAKLKINGN